MVVFTTLLSEGLSAPCRRFVAGSTTGGVPSGVSGVS
jgi:hypothetical protein|tara:strand:+ start:1772 stop:1882 length:111 start_codon:yes stop_codon:yes gene_type:complete